MVVYTTKQKKNCFKNKRLLETKNAKPQWRSILLWCCTVNKNYQLRMLIQSLKTDKQLTKDQLVALCDKLQHTVEFKTYGKGFKNVTRDLQVAFLMKKLKTAA